MISLYGLLLSASLIAHAQQPPTLDQVLISKGVSLELPALRNALRDPRPEVVGLAANALAEKNDRESIPFVKEALNRSSSPLETQNLAQALVIFGDPAGKTAMRTVCEDRRARNDLRLTTATLLLDAGDDSCSASVVDLLASTHNDGVRLYAMEFLIKLKPTVSLISAQRTDLENSLKASLDDEIPNVRKSASDCIVLFHMLPVKGDLEKAIAREKDPATLAHMKANLRTLETQAN